MKKLFLSVAFVAGLAGCYDAEIASYNLSKTSDQFEVDRRIIFYNDITGDYILEMVGKCSIQAQSDVKLAIICKTGDSEYKKHYLSDNVTYFAEHLKGFGASVYHYRVIFKPQTIVPNVDLEASISEG